MRRAPDDTKDSGRESKNRPSEDDHDIETARKPNALKRPVVRLVLIAGSLILLVSAASYGWHYWQTGRFIQSTNDAYLKADQVAAAAKISGYVSRIPVRPGQVVSVATDLVKIDDRSYVVRSEQASAQLDQAKAGEDQARAQLNRQQAEIEQAQAQVSQSQSSLAFAENQMQRYRPLAESGAEPAERYATIVNQRDQATSQVALNIAKLHSAELMVPSIAAQVAQARASVEQAEAQLHQAKIDQEDTVVKSSIDGSVGDLTVRIGQYVQPGMRLMSIVPVQDIYLEANFKETQIGLMRVGQPATVKVDALPEEELHGTVVSFSPGAGSEFSLLPPQNATGNFTKVVQRVPVRIRIDAGPEARKVLVPGLSVTVEVDTRSARGEPERVKQEGKSESGSVSK